MTDTGSWLPVAAGVLLIALTGILGYYLLQRLRAQRQRILADLSSSPVFADDRAFNQIRIARAELEVLRRDGEDVPRAGELLRDAEAALARHQNVDAVRLALDAHKLLVQARQAQRAPPSAGSTPTGSAPEATLSSPPVGPVLRPTVDLTAASFSGNGPAGPVGFPGAGTDPGDPVGRPPKNRMEAHFQMTLLVSEIDQSPGAKGRPEAEGLRAQSQSAYSRQEYTEALRLALRGRRALGVRLETLPPGRSVGGPSAPSPSPRVPAEPTSTSRTCSQCGRPVRTDDRFCRGCGATNSASLCPRCQGEIGPSDTFCGRCGAPVS